MAKKKTETQEMDETKLQPQETVENTEVVENPDEVVEAQVETQVDETEVKEEKPKAAKSKKAEKTPEVEIPNNVKKLLALYPNYEALYINAKGGVFPKNTQPSLVKDAILYQNPYFKQ